MKLSKLLTEPWLYTSAFILALVLRLTNLGSAALTDGEAAWAMQALDTLRGSHPLIGSQPAYVQLTTVLFFLFGPSNDLARLWPALFGSLLVLVPLLGRRIIGRKAAVVLAFGLALDPGLAAISRQAGGAMIAVASGWLALVFLKTRKPLLAGIALGLAVMCGETFWLGLAGLAVALGIARLLKIPLFVNQEDLDGVETLPAMPGGALRSAAIGFAASILLIGSLFFLAPRGLGASLAGLPVFLGGWASLAGVPVLQILAALLVYQPFAVALGLWAGIQAWNRSEPLDRFLGIWALAALLLVLLYPSRQASGLALVLVPVWILAARELVRHVEIEAEINAPALGVAGLTIIIAIFTWINLLGISKGIQDNYPSQSRWIAVFIGVLIVGIAGLLISWGWSREAARKGILWGICAAMSLYLVYTATNAVNLRPDQSPEFWNQDASIPKANLLIGTLDNLSDLHATRKDALDITVMGVSSPALRWALRGYSKAIFTDQLETGVQPSIVITEQEKEPALAAAYRGEGFLWYQSTNWSLMLSAEYLPWLVMRHAPLQKSSLVLWVRSDIFPDFQNSSTTDQQNQPQSQPELVPQP